MSAPSFLNSLIVIYIFSYCNFGIVLATIESNFIVSSNLKISPDSSSDSRAGGDGINTELSHLLEKLGISEGAKSTDNLKGTYIQQPQNKIVEEQLLLSAIRELHSEITALKKNLSKTDNCPVSYIQQPQNKIFEEQLLTATKELRSEISALKKNLSKTDNCPVSYIQQPQYKIFEEQLLKATREIIHSEISALKRNLSETASECLIESSIQEGKSYPVGVSYRQLCPPSSLNREVTVNRSIPRSCKEIQTSGNNVSGIYEIQPKESKKPVKVLCDMETRGGGWTVIQTRYDGSVDFYLGWREYKLGFGDLGGEFWIGLENIYKMTGFETNELLVEIMNKSNIAGYAHYKKFGIGSEAQGYPLNVLEGFSGDIGDSLTYHKYKKFSTKDYDQDGDRTGSCATYSHAAWWYDDCYHSNLNGYPANNATYTLNVGGLRWETFREDTRDALAKSRMMVRPVIV